LSQRVKAYNYLAEMAAEVMVVPLLPLRLVDVAAGVVIVSTPGTNWPNCLKMNWDEDIAQPTLNWFIQISLSSVWLTDEVSD
jgi:hypothetical protein